MSLLAPEAAESASESIRQRLTSISPDLADVAEAALREALQTTKRVRANRECQKCGCRHVDYVDVQDSPKVLEAIKLAIEQTEGRPGVADQDEAQALTIVRTVAHTLDPQHALTLMDRALEQLGDTAPAALVTLRQELLSSLPHAHTREG